MGGKAKTSPALWFTFVVFDLCIVAAVLIAFFWVAPMPAGFAGGQSVAQARAAKASGLSVVLVTADHCLMCQMYKRGALADPRVTAWIEQNAGAASLKWGVDSEAIAAIPVEGYPATVVMAGTSVLATHIGAMSAEELLEFLEGARKRWEEAGGGQGQTEDSATGA